MKHKSLFSDWRIIKNAILCCVKYNNIKKKEIFLLEPFSAISVSNDKIFMNFKIWIN